MKNNFSFRVKKENGLRYTANVSVELEDKGKGQVFSAMADVGNGGRFEIGGQCLDTIKQEYIFMKDSDKVIFDEIFYLWSNYHLNGMNAGTRRQSDAIANGYDEWYSNKTGEARRGMDYVLQCEFLKSLDLYEDKEYLVENENGEMVPYVYGTKWLYREIPETDLVRIKALFE